MHHLLLYLVQISIMAGLGRLEGPFTVPSFLRRPRDSHLRKECQSARPQTSGCKKRNQHCIPRSPTGGGVNEVYTYRVPYLY